MVPITPRSGFGTWVWFSAARKKSNSGAPSAAPLVAFGTHREELWPSSCAERPSISTSRRGQVTALVGDNGAGKSTLIKAISGISAPDAGHTLWNGQPVHIQSPKDATELGVATVYQDLALCDNLDIVQNLFLGRELLKYRLLDEAAMELRAKRPADLLSRPCDRFASFRGHPRVVSARPWPSARPESSVTRHHGRAHGRPRGHTDGHGDLALIKRLASQGVAVLVVSHNLNDVFAMADRIGVLYLGQIADSGPAEDFDRQIVVDYMTTGKSERTDVGSGGPTALADAGES